MADLLAVDGTTEEWVVVWFPPQGDKVKKFDTEEKARTFADDEDVKEWNPLLEHRFTTIVSELVPL